MPPVRDKALYNNTFYDEASSKGALIFESFQHVIELSVSYWQNNDRVFSDTLDRIVYGKTTDEDNNILSTRRYNILDRQEQEKFHDNIYIYIYIYIYPTNNEVKLKNEKYLRRLNKPVLEVHAKNMEERYCVNSFA